MNSNLYTIIKLIESSGQPFYEHIQNKDQSFKLEVYWINNQWQIRTTPYQGEWFFPKELQDYDNFDLESLEFHLSNQLLLEYSYCVINKIPNVELRLKQIQKIMGKDRCYQSIIDLENFKKAMLGALKNYTIKLEIID